MNNKISRGLVIIVITFGTLAGFSQENKLTIKQKLIVGINWGFNYTKFHSDTVGFSYGARPVVGGYANYNIYKNIYLNASTQYSMKSSSSSSQYLKVVKTYTDFNLLPQFKLCEGFYIQSGISYSHNLGTKIITGDGRKANGRRITKVKSIVSETNAIAGIEFRVGNNSNIAFNYFIPVSKIKTSNFQVTINISFYDKSFKKQHIIREKRHTSEKQIEDLKYGTLLVRLKTSEPKINALVKMGKLKIAHEVKQKQEIENKKIVAAFNSRFNYCNTVFFYSNKSGNVRNRKFENIFLNDSLQIDKRITIDTTKAIFIADFGPIEQDTSKHFSHYDFDANANWSVKKIPMYYGGPDFGFEALIIRDKNFNQLSKPFPYYTRAIFKSLKENPLEALFLVPILAFQNYSYNETVKTMNRKLTRYYNLTR